MDLLVREDDGFFGVGDRRIARCEAEPVVDELVDQSGADGGAKIPKRRSPNLAVGVNASNIEEILVREGVSV